MGKTTLSRELQASIGTVLYCDDALDLDWSAQSQAIADILGDARRCDWVIEGVPVVRGLRKWLRSHSTGKPCDTLYWSNTARCERSRGQETLAVGCQTVYDEILPELRRRGVEIRGF